MNHYFSLRHSSLHHSSSIHQTSSYIPILITLSLSSLAPLRVLITPSLLHRSTASSRYHTIAPPSLLITTVSGDDYIHFRFLGKGPSYLSYMLSMKLFKSIIFSHHHFIIHHLYHHHTIHHHSLSSSAIIRLC